MGQPRHLFCLFLVFWNKHHFNFYKKFMRKMSIQYTMPGFEPTTCWNWVSSHNHLTRAPALTRSLLPILAVLPQKHLLSSSDRAYNGFNNGQLCQSIAAFIYCYHLLILSGYISASLASKRGNTAPAARRKYHLSFDQRKLFSIFFNVKAITSSLWPNFSHSYLDCKYLR